MMIHCFATKISKVLFFLVLSFLLSVNIHAQKDKYLIEAEDFQFKGKWIAEKSTECSGGGMLRVMGGGSSSDQLDALTVIDIEEAGKYFVWVKSADYEESPGQRRLRIGVNDKTMVESGKHGKTGFYWESVGSIDLDKKGMLLRIHDVNKNFARCDAVLLLKDDSLDPNEIEEKELDMWRTKPIEMETTASEFGNISTPLPLGQDDEVIASVENSKLRMSFVKGGPNNQAIACKTEIYTNGLWRGFLSMVEDHKVFLITSQGTPIDNDVFFPSWKENTSNRSFSLGGKDYLVPTSDDFQNPFMSGNLSEAIPVQASNIDDKTIVVQYITKDGSRITGQWALSDNNYHINIRFFCTPAQKGMYSIGLAAFQPVPDAYMSNVLLPPMFQYKRISPQPQMLLSSMMQQPLAIVESKTVQGVMSSFICGDIGFMPKEWGSADYSPIGFSLKNERNEVQPIAFSPVLGMQDSYFEKGKTFERKFVIGIIPDEWNKTLEYISENIFEVKDYRKQENTSLTDAIFNIVDLMKDKEYGGWDKKLKGFYDIEGDPETAPTVVHSAPLAIIAAAIFSNDEDLYLSHALPTIEYTLSRKGYRWATDLVPSGYNKTPETLKLNPFNSQFTTSYYEGLDFLLGRLNPWLVSVALPNGELRKEHGYSARTQSWTQALSAYKLTNDAKWLRSATSTAERYINTSVYTSSSVPMGPMAFYNINFYSPWWDLIDLYEITKDAKYLKAAQYGAAHTIAGIRSYPRIDDQLQTIHSGNKYDGNTNLWWKGKDRSRLGFPRTPNDVQEKQVLEWLVSPVGLSFEQPGTYFLRTKGKQVRPVFMSNWAPHLLRLYQHTNKSIYETYARNGIIGRFANYPGYYATGYTDLTLAKDFPYQGPDVSSIYYHHIPPHLAFTWDYLVSEAIERSAGNVYFPYCKQDGFVWFDNRIYGSGKGTIFEDKSAKLLMKKGLVEIDNPSINYVTAISDKNFWLLLSSESEKDEVISVNLASSLGVKDQAEIIEYSEKGKTGEKQKVGSSNSFSVPSKGFRAIAYPLASINKETVYPVLNNGMQVIDLGKLLGKMFSFRIRSPFGWDSVFGYVETSPIKDKDVKIKIECNGETHTVSSYPFEWSFYKLGIDEAAKMKITIELEGKTITKEITLKP